MSKAVSGVNGLANGFSQFGTGRVDSISMAADSFSSIMQKTTGQGNSKMESADFQPSDSKKTDVYDSANVMKENSKAAEQIEKSAQSNEQQPTEETLKSAEEAVNETAEKVVEKVADTLGISKEEVEKAMETLGLTAVSLLEPANLTKLMMDLSGETDMLALTMNEELYMGIKDIVQMVQQELASVQEMYGLTDEQLNGCIDAVNEDALQQLVAEMEVTDEVIPVENLKAEDGEEVKLSDKTVTNAESETVVTTEEMTKLTEGNEKSAANSQGETAGKNDSQSGNLMLQNMTQNQATDAVTNSVEMTFTETQAKEIMDQIMEYMKVQVKADTTNLEMQLHPESLGTLNIRIAAKDGVLTAQFTAQNEAVKNVIEGQLMILQQNLDEQGVKVEAVEVNVATQQFNRNLDQGKGSSGQTSEEAKKKGPRRINLNDLDSLEEEELEEADRVTADMMARNGNTVDYLA